MNSSTTIGLHRKGSPSEYFAAEVDDHRGSQPKSLLSGRELLGKTVALALVERTGIGSRG